MLDNGTLTTIRYQDEILIHESLPPTSAVLSYSIYSIISIHSLDH